MTKLIALLAILAVAAMTGTAAVSWINRKRMKLAPTTASTSARPSKSAVDGAMLAAQLRAVSAVVFAVLVFLMLFRVSIVFSGMVGLPLALASGISGSAGLLLFSAWPAAKQPVSATASASLTPRSPWSFARRRSFVAALAVAATYIAFLVVTGLTSAPDGQGRYRLLRLHDASSTVATTSYPGWYYGVPLLAVTIVLAGSVILALRRIATTTSLPDPRMAPLDRRWREISTRVVLRLGAGALLGYFGGTAMTAAWAMVTIAGSMDDGPLQPLFGLGITGAAVGAALALAGVVLLVLAGKDAISIRASAREADNEPIPAS
jgi:hypothetical protein